MDKNNSKNKDMEMGRNNVTLSNTGAAAGKGRKGCRWSQLVAGLLLWGFSVTALALATPTGVQIVGQKRYHGYQLHTELECRHRRDFLLARWQRQWRLCDLVLYFADQPGQ